jgi:hypothetical protein
VIGSFIGMARRRAGLLAAALLAVAIAGSLVYWPGLMIWDSVDQYEQVMTRGFDDWHPAAMGWVWRLWTGVWKGPAPMLLMQLALYAAGLGLLVRWALRRGEGGRALALAATALLPWSVALMGEVIKDSLMNAVLVCAAGLWIGAAPEARWRRGAAAALVVATATLRYNAFLACAPLLVAMAPVAWRDRPARIAGLAVATSLGLLAVMPIANRLLGAEKSGVEYSLTIFDLGGISYHSGVDAFPPLQGVAHPVAANRRCYTPEKWDSYAEWSPEPCPIHFDLVKDTFEHRGLWQRGWWLGAIASHPIAYAEHRLEHMNINAAFLVHSDPGRAIQDVNAPNDWDFKVPRTPVLTWVDRLARWSAHTPLGWPACWMALAFGLVVLSPSLASGQWVRPLALSALLYGLGYSVFSVAAGPRYHLWTATGAALALAIALTDHIDWRAIDRRRLVTAGAPLAVVLTLSVLWRLL